VLYTYKLVDRELGRWIEQYAGPDTTVVIMSDHGGAAAHRLLNLHKLFVDRGWLQIEAAPGTSQAGAAAHSALARASLRLWNAAKRLLPQAVASRLQPLRQRVRNRLAAPLQHRQIAWDRTVAVPMGSSAGGVVRLNIAGRDRHGILPPQQAESLLAEIREALLAMRDQRGEPVFEAVPSGAEVFSGPYVSEGPDLLLVPSEPSVFALPGLHDSWTQIPFLLEQPHAVTELQQPLGVHSMEGILVMAGPQIEAAPLQEQASLLDVAPTLLYAIGEPIADYMEGKILRSLFKPRYLQAQAPTYRHEDPTPAKTQGAGYTPQQREELAQRLTGLGYL